MLRPCQYRKVTNDGQLACAKISGPNREVSAEICQACPVAAIDCQHLRVSLQKEEGGSITVRFGNGRSEVWAAEPTHVYMRRAACAALCVQISGPQMCIGCAVHRSASAARSTIGQKATADAGAGALVAASARDAECATC